MWDPDTRWIGNEEGIAPIRSYNEVDALDFSIRNLHIPCLGVKTVHSGIEI